MVDQSVDFFRSEFAGVLGHVVFAVGDDVAEFVGGGGGGWFRNERWASEMATPSSFPMTLRAVLLEDGVVGEGRVRRRSLRGDGESEEQRTDCDGESECFHVEPR